MGRRSALTATCGTLTSQPYTQPIYASVRKLVNDVLDDVMTAEKAEESVPTTCIQ